MSDVLRLPNVAAVTYCESWTGRWHRVTAGAPVADCGYELSRAHTFDDALPPDTLADERTRRDWLCGVCFPGWVAP